MFSASRGLIRRWPKSASRFASNNSAFRLPSHHTRAFSSDLPDRESMEFDVLIVGAGPAGLAAAIRLKQKNEDLAVCVVEKGSEVGAHVLSGNVFDPKAFYELFPDVQATSKDDSSYPLQTPVTVDKFYYMNSATSSVPLFVPPMLDNHGNYIISLGNMCKWLGEKAEDLGVDVFPGFAASEVLYSEDGSHVTGIATGDMGIDKQGNQKDTFERGMALLGKQVLFAEGAKGSCSEEVMEKFDLRKDCDPQVFGLGVKEIWQVDPDKTGEFKPGHVEHSLGWPNPSDVYAGTFLYHMSPDLIHVGMVVGLDYKNPYVNPYKAFQQWKHHSRVAKVLEHAKPISYGARVINEGGFQAIPKLTFPGGALLGCSAGFVNVPRIKGSHYAMKSGMLAADAILDKLQQEELQAGQELTTYEDYVKDSWIYSELKAVRNYHPSFKHGLLGGVLYSGVSALVTKGKEPWTFHTTTADRDATEPAENHTPIEYPKPDNKLSFDLLTNLSRSNTYHDDDQPSHLVVRDGHEDTPVNISLAKYDGPEQRFCPAGVYEYVTDETTNEKRLQINAQNCVHCKTCAIKTPAEFIKWTTPQGGEGPSYPGM